MTSLSGLESLTSLGGDLKIFDSNALVSISALSNLTSVGGHLSIESNNILTSLTGLESLTSIDGELNVAYNASLTNLCALYNVNLTGDLLEIHENTLLSMETAYALETRLRDNGFTGTSTITNNNGVGQVVCDEGYKGSLTGPYLLLLD